MTFEKGNKEQLKAKNPGRKTLEEELKNYKEKVKQITLEELAESRVYDHIEEYDDRRGVKEIALPVYLKSKADKHEHSGNLTITAPKEVVDIINDKINEKTSGIDKEREEI